MAKDSNTAFKINDYIMYGRVGVCIVKEIQVPDLTCVDPTKTYYMLEPVYARGNIIYTPINNAKVSMRKILTKDEARQLISNIPSIEQLEIDETKRPEEQYKQSLQCDSSKNLVGIIKSLYHRKEERSCKSKTVSAIDERYFNLAKDLLFGELAVSLALPREQVEDNFIRQIDSCDRPETAAIDDNK